jgi:apolipoprotein N-acyltransferase
MNKIVLMLRNHWYLLTAALMFLSFPSFDIWYLKGFPFFAWLSLVPILVHVRGVGMREAYLSSLATGMAGTLIVYSWIGQFGKGVPGGQIMILLMIVPSLSVFFATKIALAEFLSRRFELMRPLIFPSVWILIDGVQSIGFLAFPWTYWGYSQYTFTPFIQVSSYIGIFGITFIVICANYLLSDYVHDIITAKISLKRSMRLPSFRNIAAMSALIIIITVHGAVRIPAPEPPSGDRMKMAMVQSCIDPWEDWISNRFDYLTALKRLSAGALEQKPDFLIWSESATLELISYDYERGTLNPFEWEVLNLARENGTPLLTGEIGIIEDGLSGRIYPQNNAVLINGRGEVDTTYAKIHLVPFGEWFP